MPKIIKEYNKLSGKDADNVKLLNNLSGKEWTQLSKSVTEYSGPIAAKRKEHGAAFPPDLARHYIKIYTQPNDVVLDPFLGVGTVADTSSFMKRNCIGFEINPTFYGKAMQGIDPKDVKFLSQDQNLPLFEDNTEDENDVNISLYNESCQHISQHVDPESVDLILTSPPYADLLHKMAETFAAYTYEKNIYKNESRSLAKPYSDNNKDFGNLSWSEYQDEVRSLMGSLYEVAKPGSYNVWVVRDFRDIQNHIPYVNLHSKIIELAIETGWVLIDVNIWDQTNQRKLVKLGGPKQRRFYFNIGHSYILVFRKNLTGEKFKSLT